MIKINVLKPIGFCFGVERAINAVLDIIKTHTDKKISVFGLLVHNEIVCDILKKHGVNVVDTKSLNEEQKLSLLEHYTCEDFIVFTAHGVPNEYKEILKKNNVQFFDTECPIVEMNHKNILQSIKDNKEVIFLGIENHPETIASLSLAKSNLYFYDIKKEFNYSLIKTSNPEVYSQTTLSLHDVNKINEEILKHIPNAHINKEVCNNATIRQQNIIQDKNKPDLVLVIGSESSSNTDQLFKIASKKYKDCTVLKINDVSSIKNLNYSNIKEVTITSGTSALAKTNEEVISFLEGINNGTI